MNKDVWSVVQDLSYLTCPSCICNPMLKDIPFDRNESCESVVMRGVLTIKSLVAELEQVKQERDAAIADMERLQGLICQVCKEYYQPDPEIRKYSCKIYGEYYGETAEDGLLYCGKFKWRGLQE